MEHWQKLGCYAAGLALDSAGAKEDAALKSRMHLIVRQAAASATMRSTGRSYTGLATRQIPACS